jgi:hypothetical protein
MPWIKYEILKLILTELQQNKTMFIIAEGVMLGGSVRITEEVFAQVKSESLWAGLEVNANKTKYMRISGTYPTSDRI